VTDLKDIFRAGMVRRWHTNPDMCDTCDPTAYHAGRVARIILALHPNPPAGLLAAALTHDDGEAATGDIAYPAKRTMPAIARDWLESAERNARVKLWGAAAELYMDDPWLKFADQLDAYMWAARHAPHILAGDGWPEQRARIEDMAIDLGVAVDLTRGWA
jgi:5'-deoxynucleotidase YfbR-like HD superfamily hydrolase